MMAPDRKTVSRLSAICGRLASDHEGERAVAALLATRILADAGSTWADVIERAFAPQPGSASRPPRRFTRVPTDAEDILAMYRELLGSDVANTWERKFLADLLEREICALTEKQEAKLRTIIRKHAAAARGQKCAA